MCLIAFSFDPDADQKLLVFANRDEFYEREASQAGFWPDQPGLLAGRDLVAGGTWLGVHSSGRFAAVTNFREPGVEVQNALSRGRMVTEFLTEKLDSNAFLSALQDDFTRYNGFNLIVYDGEKLGYCSNRAPFGPQLLKKGIYGLSNDLLDSPWPKVTRAKQRLENAVSSSPNADSLWSDPSTLGLLGDPSKAPDNELPDTGVGLELERTLSAMTIQSPNYGTRCMTMVGLWQNGSIRFAEKTLHPVGLDAAILQFEIQPRMDHLDDEPSTK
jgi:uncharacterized protein with NRDE domain